MYFQKLCNAPTGMQNDIGKRWFCLTGAWGDKGETYVVEESQSGGSRRDIPWIGMHFIFETTVLINIVLIERHVNVFALMIITYQHGAIVGFRLGNSWSNKGPIMTQQYACNCHCGANVLPRLGFSWGIFGPTSFICILDKLTILTSWFKSVEIVMCLALLCSETVKMISTFHRLKWNKAMLLCMK